MRNPVAIWLAICACLCSTGAAAQVDEPALWRGLANGDYVALMRHASAPGYGDPEGFDIDDCSTQRNLSDAGRSEASAIGNRLRTHGIDTARVRSSQWCRCLETARLLDLGPVTPTPSLNSFFDSRDRREEQTAAVRRLLDDAQSPGARVLVTHQVNITALTGVGPAAGEIVVVRPDGPRFEVVGRIGPP